MNRLSQLLNIKHPIIQAGMVWCSGWELAAASSKAGILGTIGAGSMYPEVLRSHISKCKAARETNFAVNLPLLYPQIEEHIKTILEQEVPVVITSAGNPRKWTSELKSKGVIVGHVVSSKKFALKAQDAGVDFIVAEGFEAGGHNGREETTTMCLIPEVADAIEIPLAAAGGIADARSMIAAMVLGADGVQIGSRFVASKESSAHDNFKSSVVQANEGQTELTLKELTPVRLLEGGFLYAVREAYANDASAETLKELLGRGRAKKGMFEGDLEEGELEIGQVSSRIDKIMSVEDIVKEIISDYQRMNPQGLGVRFQLA